MGAAPSRETHRRGLFTVHQGSAPAMSSKKQDIVLVPLTREFFPSPDCPLFVQFHRARCDAAVNYYFRRPGDPGDLSSIPHYDGSFPLPEERLKRRRGRAEAARAATSSKRKGQLVESKEGEGNGMTAASASSSDAVSASSSHNHSTTITAKSSRADPEVVLMEIGTETEVVHTPRATAAANANTTTATGGSKGNTCGGSADRKTSDDKSGAIREEEEEEDDDDEESVSFPSREALYRGVIDHIEEVLFDTDEEMRESYAIACANPGATIGPDGRKLKKVLPVLCAVAFRSDASKLVGAIANNSSGSVTVTSADAGLSTAPFPSAAAVVAAAAASPFQQVATEAGVYHHGSILNIVGCFGFASMQDEVDAMQEQLQMRQPRHGSVSPTSPAALSGVAASRTMGSSSIGNGGAHQAFNPYGAVGAGSQLSSNNSSMYLPVAGTNFSLASSLPNGSIAAGADGGRPGSTASSSVRRGAAAAAAADLMTLPQPIAAPLAALVFLTKSAGEQNLGRVTHIAATTYYYQLIQAGVIQRRGAEPYAKTSAAGAGPGAAPGSLPCSNTPTGLYGHTGAPPGYYGNAVPPPPLPSLPQPQPPMMVPGQSYGNAAPPMPPYGYGYRSATYPPTSPLTSMPELFHPPMETFSFSSLMTNIPILSFMYEMKCRWGYLGVLKGSTPTANSSFASSSVTSFPGFAGGGRRAGTMMGNHSTGGLAAIDPYSGENVTDEMEMWITPDHMIHGRVSRDLASRLCLSLAERPEVMQERVLQLPSEEEGYWRYKGLVSRARPPPVPAPGRIVSIHPKDVYVMGSDVLPGFDEGDILRFDPDRLVWFADHSIPLEGVVLAAMRPHCKCAREAEPTDEGWVTRLVPEEELAHLQEKGGAALFPPPPASAAQAAEMAEDSTLQLTHEHVGNFYIFRFVRDGTTYYHGTIPNFANPNKRKATATGAAAAATATAAGTVDNPTSAGNAETHAGKANAAASSADKPAVQVPRTIAGALFSLFPARAKTTPAAAGNGDNDNGAASAANAKPEARSTTAGGAAGATKSCSGLWEANFPTQTSSQPPRPPVSTGIAAIAATTPSAFDDTPAYLRGRVTSTAIEAARTLMRNLYSYAYGAPVRTPGPSAAGVTMPPSPVRTPVGGVRRGGAATSSTGDGSNTYPTVSSAHPGMATAAAAGSGMPPVTVMAPTAASLHGVGGAAVTATATTPVMSAAAAAVGMYPRSRRPASSTARSSANSSSAVRYMNPTGAPISARGSPAAVPGAMAAVGGSSLRSPVNPMTFREAYWPPSPSFTPELSAIGLEARSPAGSTHGSLSHPSHQPLNVHVRVSSRSLNSPLLHSPTAAVSALVTTTTEAGWRGTEDGVGSHQALPRQGSQSDSALAGLHPVMQPSTQVRRYREGGNYVWDWRIGVTSAASGGGSAGGVGCAQAGA